MVYYLHSANDTAASSRDLARLYATRTMGAVSAVNGDNLRTTMANVLHQNMRVVYTSDKGRRGIALHTLLTILDHLKWNSCTVDDYLNELQRPAPQAAPQLPSAVAGR